MRMHGNNKNDMDADDDAGDAHALIELATLKNEPKDPLIRFTCDNKPATFPLVAGDPSHVTTSTLPDSNKKLD